MDVVLIKKAKYNLSTDKLTVIPGDIFDLLMEADRQVEDTTGLPRVIMFENKEDFLKYGGYDLDLDKDVYVSKKGQIFCFLKSILTIATSNATDTKKDTAK